jgi:hypothetical protein
MTVAALLLAVRLPAAAQSGATEDSPSSIAEIRQLRELLLNQAKAIEALRAQVAEQQEEIEALRRPAGPSEAKNTPPPAVMTSLPTVLGSAARPSEKKEAPSTTPAALLKAGNTKPEAPSSGRNMV